MEERYVHAGSEKEKLYVFGNQYMLTAQTLRHVIVSIIEVCVNQNNSQHSEKEHAHKLVFPNDIDLQAPHQG